MLGLCLLFFLFLFPTYIPTQSIPPPSPAPPPGPHGGGVCMERPINSKSLFTCDLQAVKSSPAAPWDPGPVFCLLCIAYCIAYCLCTILGIPRVARVPHKVLNGNRTQAGATFCCGVQDARLEAIGSNIPPKWRVKYHCGALQNRGHHRGKGRAI